MAAVKNKPKTLAVWPIGLALVLLTLLAYWPVLGFQFINFDDQAYVYENPVVQQGLSWSGVQWAFTTTQAANWHPVTWLSHCLDCQLYGLNAGQHHLTNLLLHSASVLLLFIVLRKMTGATWRSAFVAAIFGLHPLHVESVAWVAERKDVLSGMFFMLTVWAYAAYVQLRISDCGLRNKDTNTPGCGKGWFALALLFFLLGLMSKPMLVTLPFVLLLLDFWPLGRWRGWRTVLEKTPFFLLSATACAVTFSAQKTEGAISSMGQISLTLRVENTLVAYATYLGKMFWPGDMAILYLRPSAFPGWQVIVAGLLLAAISGTVIWLARKQPYLSMGWFWFLGTLVPVIGLIAFGVQSRADRYVYLPSIGVTIMLAWGLPELLKDRTWRRSPVAITGGLACAACFFTTRSQVHYWRDSFSLFEHTVKVTKDNYIAQNNLGRAFEDQGNLDAAEEHYQEAVRLNPQYGVAQYNLGNVLTEKNRLDEAITHLKESIRLMPKVAETYNNLGKAYAMQRRLDEAMQLFSEAIKVNPDCEPAHLNLGRGYGMMGKMDLAAAEFQTAVRLAPNDSAARQKLAEARAQLGK